MIIKLLLDGLFAAIAAIGFSSISNPPKRIYAYCAVVAAVGHSLRFALMWTGLHIIPASAIAAFVIGCMSVLLSRYHKCPPESCFSPALLPMIPGMYAYRTFAAIAMCWTHAPEAEFSHYLYLMSYNGIVCSLIMLGMVIGVNVPVFLLKNTSFSATR